MSEPDFYLASTEGYGMEEPRRCWRLKRIASAQRGDLLLVRIEPPLLGQRFDLGGKDVDLVLLAPRHDGASLFPVTTWPTYVHVARPLVDAPETYERLGPGEMEVVAWAEIYPTEDDARMKVM